MIIFHSFHVLSVVLKTIVVLVLSGRGYWTRECCQGIKVNGLYWHSVRVCVRG
jgi:cytochrome c oxidase subunit I+III